MTPDHGFGYTHIRADVEHFRAETDKTTEAIRLMDEQLRTLKIRLNEIEDEEAWQEGHGLLCKAGGCDHHNPNAL